MSREIIGICPVCGATTEVTEIHCPSCDVRISGRFRMDKFARLNAEQKAFVEVFLRCRGNIREVERELGVSYPTVRARLDAVIQALGHPVSSDDGSLLDAGVRAARRKQILDRLAAGELSASEAARLLKELR